MFNNTKNGKGAKTYIANKKLKLVKVIKRRISSTPKTQI